MMDTPTPTKLQVLIVEDDKLQSALLERVLMARIGKPLLESGYGLFIKTVTTLAEALSNAKDSNVTILDLDLPDADPLQTISSLGAFRPPVIVMTGTDDEEVHARCKLNGADHVFVKGQIHGLCRVLLDSMMKDILITQGLLEKTHAVA